MLITKLVNPLQRIDEKKSQNGSTALSSTGNTAMQSLAAAAAKSPLNMLSFHFLFFISFPFY